MYIYPLPKTVAKFCTCKNKYIYFLKTKRLAKNWNMEFLVKNYLPVSPCQLLGPAVPHNSEKMLFQSDREVVSE